ncbi:hypothetical protein Hanom_Chr10g00963681 [Helianthus anomalus]
MFGFICMTRFLGSRRVWPVWVGLNLPACEPDLFSTPNLNTGTINLLINSFNFFGCGRLWFGCRCRRLLSRSLSGNFSGEILCFLFKPFPEVKPHKPFNLYILSNRRNR